MKRIGGLIYIYIYIISHVNSATNLSGFLHLSRHSTVNTPVPVHSQRKCTYRLYNHMDSRFTIFVKSDRFAAGWLAGSVVCKSIGMPKNPATGMWKPNPFMGSGCTYLRVAPVLGNWRINFRQGRRWYTADRHRATGCVQVRGDSSCLACLTFVHRQSARNSQKV